jgi:hypothetical protein
MNKNIVKRHWERGKLAKDGEAQREPKRPGVNGARVRGKLSHLIRGDLSLLRRGQESAAVVVVDGVTTIQGGW